MKEHLLRMNRIDEKLLQQWSIKELNKIRNGMVFEYDEGVVGLVYATKNFTCFNDF